MGTMHSGHLWEALFLQMMSKRPFEWSSVTVPRGILFSPTKKYAVHISLETHGLLAL